MWRRRWRKKNGIFIACGHSLLGAMWVRGCSGPTAAGQGCREDAAVVLHMKTEWGSAAAAFGCVWALLGQAEVAQVGRRGTRAGLGGLSPLPGTGWGWLCQAGDGAPAARLGQKSHQHSAGSSGKCQAAPRFLGLGIAEQRGRISLFPSQ